MPRPESQSLRFLALGIVAIDVAVAVVVDLVVANLDVAVVDHAIAVVVEAIVANFLGLALAAAIPVRCAVAVVVERVPARVHTSALRVVRGMRPESAMVALLNR